MPDGITREKALRILRTKDKRMIDRELDIVGLLASHTRGEQQTPLLLAHVPEMPATAPRSLLGRYDLQYL